MAEPPHKGLFLAVFDFGGEREGTVAFLKGDELELQDSSQLWWIVTNRRTGKTGKVPSNYLAEVGILDSYDWFHPTLDIVSSRESLSEDGLKKGTFVVIPDEVVKGRLRLVVRKKSRVRSEVDIADYSIGVTLGDEDRDEFFISKPAKSHTTIPSLVQSLHKRTEGTKCKLDGTILKTRPALPIDYSGFDIERQHLHVGEKIGGPGSIVRNGTYGDVRVILKEIVAHQRISNFREVIKCYSKLNSSNIIKIFGCVENNPVVVLEYCSYTLLGRLAELENDPYENQELYLGYANQVTNGMECLEDNSIIHGKLCARNLLLKEDGTVVLINFGLLGRGTYEDDPEYSAWNPIEVLKGKPHDECADVWAYAIVLYEIFTGGMQPYKGVTRDIVSYIESGKRLPRPRRCPHEYYQIMLDCWHYNPKQRPFFRDMISKLTSHHYLIGVSVEDKTTGHHYQNVDQQ